MERRFNTIVSVFFCLCLFSAEQSTARQYHQLPAISQTYSPERIKGYHEVWGITSDLNGNVYVGTREGVSVFDGVSWKLVQTDKSTTVRSLELGFDGRVYVGEKGDIGYLSPDSTGQLRYQSLITELDFEGSSFSDVWNIHAIGDSVFFQTGSGFLILEDGGLRWIGSGNGIHTSFAIKNRVVARERGVGLVHVENDGLQLIEGTEFFSEMRVFTLFERSGGDWLVGTRDNGFFVFNPVTQNVQSLPTAFDHTLGQVQVWLYGGVEVSKGLYALKTLGAGILLMSEDGGFVNHFQNIDETGDDQVQEIHITSSGEIWVGKKNSGVSVLADFSSLSKYGEIAGLEGVINGFAMRGNSLQVASSSGLFYTEVDTEYRTIRDKFAARDSIVIAWDFVSTMNGDLVASDDGLWLIDNSPLNPNRYLYSGQTYSVEPDRHRDQVYWVGTKSGIGYVNLKDRTPQTTVIEVGAEVRGIIFTNFEEEVWAIGERDSLYRIVLSSDLLKSEMESYPVIHDETNDNILASLVDGEITYSTGGDFYQFDRDSLQFYPLQYLNEGVHPNAMGTRIQAFSQSSPGELWIAFEDSIQILKAGFDDHGTESPKALKFHRSQTSTILVDSTGVVWFNNGSELIRYDPKYDVPGSKVFNARIASVKKASDGEALFSGFHRAENGGIAGEQPEWSIPVLDYDSRNLTFQFSATEFINPEAVQYRHRIDGKDAGTWTEWSDERETMTPSIREGSYTIVVQAKDEIGRLSELATYSFVILPPWYRTIWAYMAYLILGAGTLVSGRKYLHMRRAHKLAAEQAKELERERNVVKRLSEANDRLLQANKLKDEFLATTSHELRTPLTAILGFTSVLKDEIPEEAEYREFLDIIEDSGSRLMDTLNSLLDLAKLRAGIMEVNLEAVDLYQQTFQEVVQLQNAAQKKGIRLKVRRPESALYAISDVYGLSRVVHNLVGNAIKFTDEGMVEVWFEEKGDKVDIHVTDSGIGIDAEFLPELFNAFIQESDGLARTHEGTGLGLAITSGIVQLMDASIRVESEKGKGSDFIVTLVKATTPRQRPRRVSGMGNTASA
jgi:signal transduction histidine kinase/ligand-binding sensor domain-containing protein